MWGSSLWGRVFKKSSSSAMDSLERKSMVVDDSSESGIFNALLNNGYHDLVAFYSILLYGGNSAASTGIDLLANEFASLKVKVFNKKTELFIKKHPVLDLLNQPNPIDPKHNFMVQLASFYLITGNTYLVGTGRVTNPPLEIFIAYPQNVTIDHDSRDGFAGRYNIDTTTNSFRFKREEIGNRFRYFDNGIRELWQIKHFNPRSSALYGRSILSSIYPEIEQYNQSSVHNLSLLLRGGRPSGVLLFNTGGSEFGSDGLTDDQFNRLKQQTQAQLRGSSNAGKLLISEGPGANYRDMMITNRDMDFRELREDSRQQIYMRLQIPLPLAMPGRQTFSNMEKATESLYDMAVLPLANLLFSELTSFLMPKYKDGEDLILTYDPSDIPALSQRRTRLTREKGLTGIYTINELRREEGMESLTEGGDLIYKPASEVPIASDQFTDDNIQPPADDDSDDDSGESAKEKFLRLSRENTSIPEEKLKKIANLADLY